MLHKTLENTMEKRWENCGKIGIHCDSGHQKEGPCAVDQVVTQVELLHGNLFIDDERFHQHIADLLARVQRAIGEGVAGLPTKYSRSVLPPPIPPWQLSSLDLWWTPLLPAIVGMLRPAHVEPSE